MRDDEYPRLSEDISEIEKIIIGDLIGDDAMMVKRIISHLEFFLLSPSNHRKTLHWLAWHGITGSTLLQIYKEYNAYRFCDALTIAMRRQWGMNDRSKQSIRNLLQDKKFNKQWADSRDDLIEKIKPKPKLTKDELIQQITEIM